MNPPTPRFFRVFTLLAVLSCVASGVCVLTVSQAQGQKALGVEAKPVLAVEQIGGNRQALIIGINNYEDARIPDLKYSESDARALYDTLTDPAVGGFAPENVTLLLGAQATSRGVKKGLARLREQAGEDDLVVVFFSGHGAKQRGETCWVTQDAELKHLAETALTNDVLKKYLDAIASKRLVAFIDACYAADTVINQKAVVDVGSLARQFVGEGRVTIASAGGGQESIEVDALRQGVFTHFLVSGLRGAADAQPFGNGDGVQTLDEVWSYLSKRVAAEARRHQGIQVPTKHALKETRSDLFLLTINAPRIEARLRESAETKALRAKRLAALESMYLNEKLTRDQAQQGMRLLRTNALKLDAFDQKRLAYYVQVADGALDAAKLQRALDLIETPAQREARLAREARQREVREREAFLLNQLAIAKANDSEAKGRVALRALEDLLKVDPDHAEGLALREKIVGYFGPSKVGDTWTNSIGMKFAFIPSGEFLMGSPAGESGRYEDELLHQVFLSDAFMIGSTEVT